MLKKDYMNILQILGIFGLITVFTFTFVFHIAALLGLGVTDSVEHGQKIINMTGLVITEKGREQWDYANQFLQVWAYIGLPALILIIIYIVGFTTFRPPQLKKKRQLFSERMVERGLSAWRLKELTPCDVHFERWQSQAKLASDILTARPVGDNHEVS